MHCILFFCYFLSFCSTIIGAELLFKPAVLPYNGGSILTCNTVKCRGGHKCIMTNDECHLSFKTEPFAPTNCESRPKCVPDKICKACGSNEHRTRCSICDRTCEDPNRYKCKKENICGQNSRCVCDSGFVRDKSGKCVNYLECPNVSKTTRTPTSATTTPEEGFIVISKKETKQRHEQIDLLKPSTKNPNGRTEKPDRPGKPGGPKDKPDDGFIIVKEKQDKHKPDRNNPKPTSNPSKPGKPDKPGKKPTKDQPDDGFIIVKGKEHKQTKRPSRDQPSKKPTKSPNDDGFIVVHENRKNNNEKPKNDDTEFFVAKKKVQNNKHDQTNLM